MDAPPQTPTFGPSPAVHPQATERRVLTPDAERLRLCGPHTLRHDPLPSLGDPPQETYLSDDNETSSIASHSRRLHRCSRSLHLSRPPSTVGSPLHSLASHGSERVGPQLSVAIKTSTHIPYTKPPSPSLHPPPTHHPLANKRNQAPRPLPRPAPRV